MNVLAYCMPRSANSGLPPPPITFERSSNNDTYSPNIVVIEEFKENQTPLSFTPLRQN